MPVVLIHQGAGLTKESYEEVGRRITGGKGLPESPSDWPVPGLLVHAAGEAEGGFRVDDSRDRRRGFSARRSVCPGDVPCRPFRIGLVRGGAARRVSHARTR